MAIQTVQVIIEGTTHTLTKGSGNTWTATVTAPNKTSWSKPNHQFNCTAKATNTANTTTTKTGSDLSGLLLRVKEKTVPVITITSPSAGAFVTNNMQTVQFKVVDEANGSGIDLATLVVKMDNTTVAAATLSHTSITNGYTVTYTPPSALSDGQHTIKIDVKDNDGNSAVQKSSSFTVDTVAPVLNVSSPTEGLITNNSSLLVAGKTNDVTSSPVVVKIKLNSTDQGTISVDASGNFSKNLTLAEGSNTIQITATDSAGKVTTVSRTVTLDTTSPVISNVIITPNPADAGATITISVTVTG